MGSMNLSVIKVFTTGKIMGQIKFNQLSKDNLLITSGFQSDYLPKKSKINVLKAMSK